MTVYIGGVPQGPKEAPNAPAYKPLMTPEQRTQRASNAALAKPKGSGGDKWSSGIPWETIPLDNGFKRLADLREENEIASSILQRRYSEIKIDKGKCFVCHSPIDITSGRFAGSLVRTNPETFQHENIYACKAACFMLMTRKVQEDKIANAQKLSPVEETEETKNGNTTS